MRTPPPVILAIAGPTGVGKTAAAVEIARALGGEMVNADSIQIYKEFDIGSAKPSTEELKGVETHLLGVLAPSQPVDAALFAHRADQSIEAIAKKGRLPIVVGGTGLWLRALLRGLAPLPPVDPDLRRKLQERAERDRGSLFETLGRVDPASAARIHPNDRVRVVRALEVYEQTGQPLGEIHRLHALGSPRYRTTLVVLDLPDEVLRSRIEARAEAMLSAGWVDEVRGLIDRYGVHLRGLRSVGYRQIVECLMSESGDGLARAIVKATRRYARQQRNWFRSEPGVSWRTTPSDIVGAAALERLDSQLRGASCAQEGGDTEML